MSENENFNSISKNEGLVDLQQVDPLAYESLQSLLSSAYMYDGNIIETKHLVEKFGKNKIYINSLEHAPPHFHFVNSDKEKATFTIKECKLLKGSISPKNKAFIEYWHEHKNGKNSLIRVWNNTRPSNCPVGKIDL